MSETKQDEGVRSAAVLLSQIEDGAAHAELSEEIHTVVGKLLALAAEQNKDVKGKVTLALDLSVTPKGFVAVRADVSSKVPRKKGGASHFWVTKGGNLTVENPRQQKLPLREIPAAKPVELAPDAREIRNV